MDLLIDIMILTQPGYWCYIRTENKSKNELNLRNPRDRHNRAVIVERTKEKLRSSFVSVPVVTVLLSSVPLLKNRKEKKKKEIYAHIYKSAFSSVIYVTSFVFSS